jgi:hypothetical protein
MFFALSHEFSPSPSRFGFDDAEIAVSHIM